MNLVTTWWGFFEGCVVGSGGAKILRFFMTSLHYHGHGTYKDKCNVGFHDSTRLEAQWFGMVARSLVWELGNIADSAHFCRPRSWSCQEVVDLYPSRFPSPERKSNFFYWIEIFVRTWSFLPKLKSCLVLNRLVHSERVLVGCARWKNRLFEPDCSVWLLSSLGSLGRPNILQVELKVRSRYVVCLLDTKEESRKLRSQHFLLDSFLCIWRIIKCLKYERLNQVSGYLPGWQYLTTCRL